MYDCLCYVRTGVAELTARHSDFVYQFTHPYVCVIHEPTKRGYYLNREYNLIIEVTDIPRPGFIGRSRPMLDRVVPHETEPEHRASSFTTPKWAEELPPSEFTTYWLY
jgi:hypothetical protein